MTPRPPSTNYVNILQVTEGFFYRYLFYTMQYADVPIQFVPVWNVKGNRTELIFNADDVVMGSLNTFHTKGTKLMYVFFSKILFLGFHPLVVVVCYCSILWICPEKWTLSYLMYRIAFSLQSLDFRKWKCICKHLCIVLN